MNERDAATEALIREVDEDLKRDQFDKLWKQYGKYVVGLAVVLVLGVAANEGWRSLKISRAQEESAKFQAAAQKRDIAALEELAKTGKTVYAPLASFKKAALLTVAGNGAQAIEAYQDGANAKEMGPLYQQAARLHALMMQIDTGDAAKLEAELAPLAQPGEPWRHSAQELQALLAIRTGFPARALEILTRLSDDATAPQGLRARASELRQALESKGRS